MAHRLQVCAVLFAAALLLLAASPATATRAPNPNSRGLVILRSCRSFEKTWSNLIAALEANANIRVIAKIDHAAAASAAGLRLAPNRVVVFGNPALGTPVMQASRTAGLDLPQKMHVFQRRGRVFVAYNPTSYLAARHRTGPVATYGTIAGALANLASVAAGVKRGAARERCLRKIRRFPGIWTRKSANDFEKTWSRLLAAIDKSPANVSFVVDHGKNSGGKLLPTRLVVFGNPRLGTPLMQVSPTTGIDLPLKILVWQDDKGVTRVSTTKTTFLKSRHWLFGVKSTLRTVSTAVSNFVNAAVTA